MCPAAGGVDECRVNLLQSLIDEDRKKRRRNVANDGRQQVPCAAAITHNEWKTRIFGKGMWNFLGNETNMTFVSLKVA